MYRSFFLQVSFRHIPPPRVAVVLSSGPALIMELGDMSLYDLLQKGTVPPEGPKFAQEIAVGVFGPWLIHIIRDVLGGT